MCTRGRPPRHGHAAPASMPHSSGFDAQGDLPGRGRSEGTEGTDLPGHGRSEGTEGTEPTEATYARLMTQVPGSAREAIRTGDEIWEFMVCCSTTIHMQHRLTFHRLIT